MVVIPIRGLEQAKSRLGQALDAEERRDLVTRLLERTIAAARAAGRVDSVVVVSPDPATLELAIRAGARGLPQHGRGLNCAVEEARDLAIAEGIRSMLVLPGDLPFVDGPALDALIAATDSDDEPLVALVPDRHGRGTNALFLRPPDVIDSAFGGDSRDAHTLRARAAGARYLEQDGTLGIDVDTPEDLLLVDEMDRARDQGA
jgi:2-phospho-L-lactate guanylyltransferase